MADMRKLKLGIGQMRLIEGQRSRNEAAVGRMVECALDAGADALIVPNSFTDARDVRIIALNDSRLDVSGDIALLEARGEAYRIGLGAVPSSACDFSVAVDTRPFTVVPASERPRAANVMLAPVGIREAQKKVVVYDGGTSVVSSDGRLLLQLDDALNPDFGTVDFTTEAPSQAKREGKRFDALVKAIEYFDDQVLGQRLKWIVGLSGGLDSSVTAALLAMALGSERILVYNMATRFNSDATKGNASRTAEALGIPLKNGSIENLVVSLGNTLVQYGYPSDALKGVVLENAQARARGNLLSAFSAVEGGVVVNNGNRLECALGYATLYGDAIGALAPIADLTKVALFDVARQLNRRLGVEAVPENLLPTLTKDGCTWETMPSAELANAQVDPMKWFYHDWLVPTLLGDDRMHAVSPFDAACDVMEAYLHDKLASSPAGRWVPYYGLDDPQVFADDLEWVLSSMQRSAFKRLQGPPVVTLASPASVEAALDAQTPEEPPARFTVLLGAVRSQGRA